MSLVLLLIDGLTSRNKPLSFLWAFSNN